VEQSRQAGASPYPYPLLRAHEVAVVKMDDREEIIRMLERELAERGFLPSSQSYKQINKGFQDRKRI
jgi:NurA-like 5'-3' nuclease